MKLMQNGRRVRGVTGISNPITVVRELLDIGGDVRHIDQYRSVFVLVADKREHQFDRRQ
jgi:hypothetical protein